MSITLQAVPEEVYGQYAVASVVFVDGVGRWKLQKRSHLNSLFLFTDEVWLEDAEIIIDNRLVQKKIDRPDSGHMFAFVGGKLCAPRHNLSVKRVNISTRFPKRIEEVFFKYVLTEERLVDFSVFFGDNKGHAWVA